MFNSRCAERKGGGGEHHAPCLRCWRRLRSCCSCGGVAAPSQRVRGPARPPVQRPFACCVLQLQLRMLLGDVPIERAFSARILGRQQRFVEVDTLQDLRDTNQVRISRL